MRFDLTDIILAMDDDGLLRLLAAWEDPEDHRTAGEVGDAVLGVLPAALLQRYDEGGRAELLDRAIPFIRGCAADSGIGADLRSSVRANLVTALRLEYLRNGRVETLEEAIAASQALTEEEASGDDLAGRLATLARLYALRAEGFNSPGDVTRAISALGQSVNVYGISVEKAAACWSDLAGAWRAWYAINPEPDALRQVMSAAEEAVRLDPSVINRVNLASARRLYAVAVSDIAELAESITELSKIAEGQENAGAHCLHNLGLGHAEMSRLTGSPASREAAVTALRGALGATPPEQHLYASIAVDLAGTLLLEREGTEEALHLLDRASAHPAATALSRFDAAVTAAKRRSGLDALVSWRRAVTLLPILAWRGSRYRDRESAVSRFAGAARTGAACATAEGAPGEAIGMLETGRGILWSQLLEARADLDRLRARRPDLAVRLDTIRSELERTHHV